MNKETYKPYTLVGPTVTRPLLDPLAVLLLHNQLYMSVCHKNVTFWLKTERLKTDMLS